MKSIQVFLFLLFSFIYATAQNVGVGTDDPSGKVEIYSNGTVSTPQLLLYENDNDYARIKFENNNSNYWSINAYNASDPRNDRVNFWNGINGDLLTLAGDGRLGLNVGISPKVSFHVGSGHRVLFGNDTLGSGDKLMFLPDLHAFRVGTVATGAASTYWNRDSIGVYSFASGLNTRAQGYGATAMGRDTEATNSYAFATGYFTNADGQYSTAMGFNTDASGNSSIALGNSTDALGWNSTSLGIATTAGAFASLAIGRHNIGNGNVTTWVETDPLFEIGIGINNSNPENAMTVLKNGNVGIGTDSPAANLQVIGTTRLGSAEEITDGGSFSLDFDATLRPAENGSRSLGNSTKRWSVVYAINGTINTSDMRDKENITELNYGLAEVMKLRPVRFNWIENSESGDKIGLIAQELQEVIEEVVVDTEWIEDEKTGLKREVEAERLGVYYADLVPVLIKSIQEQQEIINQLNERIKKLEDRLD